MQDYNWLRRKGLLLFLHAALPGEGSLPMDRRGRNRLVGVNISAERALWNIDIAQHVIKYL